MPSNLAKTELSVRPCIAFLSPTSSSTPSSSTTNSDSSSSTNITTTTNPEYIYTATAAAEDRLIHRLDPKEVAAIFTAPFRAFLHKSWDPASHLGHPGPMSKTGAKHSWYRGAWTDWHESRWRMHNFY